MNERTNERTKERKIHTSTRRRAVKLKRCIAYAAMGLGKTRLPMAAQSASPRRWLCSPRLGQDALGDRSRAVDDGDDARIVHDLFPQSLHSREQLVGIERRSSLRDGARSAAETSSEVSRRRLQIFERRFNLRQILGARRLQRLHIFGVSFLRLHRVSVRRVRRAHRRRILHPRVVVSPNALTA